MNLKKYFLHPKTLRQKQYEALKLHFLENISIQEASTRFDLSPSYLTKEKFRAQKSLQQGVDPFFIERTTGPKTRHKTGICKEDIIGLRNKNYSIVDIKAALEARGFKISLNAIDQLIKSEGLSRLPRRTYQEKTHLSIPKKISSPRASEITIKTDEFSTGRSGGVLCFLPLLEKLGIIDAIKSAGFPETKEISSISYVLSFLVLKLIGNNRLSHDESWALDRVLGFFAGLDVLPKSASLASYSYRITRECNRKFLVVLNKIFSITNESCEFNLDFKTIPHWGDESVLEKNYSTTRGKAVKSVLALIVQDITNDRLTYTNAEICHKNEKDGVLEFVDFWKESHGTCPKMLIFDSQCTIYENLSKLNADNIKFLTLRRRRGSMMEQLKSIPETDWKHVKVEAGKRGSRKVKVYEEMIKLKKYNGTLRQLIMIDHSKAPIFMLTNDLESPASTLIRKYGRRWLVEQEIAEQIAFFNLNQLSSSIVVKVDFDLTMTLLAHNLYRCLGAELSRHEKSTVKTLHRRFIEGRATVRMTEKDALVTLSKRSHSPLLFEVPWMKEKINLSWLGLKLGFEIGSSS